MTVAEDKPKIRQFDKIHELNLLYSTLNSLGSVGVDKMIRIILSSEGLSRIQADLG